MAEERETVVPPAGDDKKAEIAELIAHDFDLAVAVRSLAAAVLALAVRVEGLERGRHEPLRRARKDGEP